VAVQIRNPDYIKYEGEYFMITNNPMEVFFKSNPELKPKAESVIMQMSKNYSAVYEIKNGDLYLIQLEYQRFNKDSVLESVNWIEETFNDLEEVKLSWFTAALIIEPFTRNHELKSNGKYQKVSFVKGAVTDTSELTIKEVDKFKHQLFEKFKMTPEYEQLTNDYPDWSSEEIERIIVADSIVDLLTKFEE
jgi:hypothetical protein